MLTAKKVYLATPYSKRKDGKGLIEKFVRWWRFRQVTKTAVYWVLKGYNVFSPITLTHPYANHLKKSDLTHEAWLALDFQWIDDCDEVWVFCQCGWQTSSGVKQEVKHAHMTDTPVRYLQSCGTKFWDYSLNEWF
jgi:hypothetical protein